MEKKDIVIFSANVARRLLRDGYIIIDIKPDKKDTSGMKTVFVFRNENNIMKKIEEYKKEQTLSRWKRVTINYDYYLLINYYLLVSQNGLILRVFSP